MRKKRFPPDCWDQPATPSHARKSARAKKNKTICPPDCWDPPAKSLHARGCLTVGTHLVEAYIALSFWSRKCMYILVDVEARTCRSRSAHVACTCTYNGEGARKKIRPRTYIRAGSRTPTRAYVHGWVGTEKQHCRRVHGEPTGWVGMECVVMFIVRAWREQRMETTPAVPQNGGNGLLFDRPRSKRDLVH